MSEPLAVEFANTWHAVRGKEQEGVGTPAELSRWLGEHGLPAGVEVAKAAVGDFLTLRDAIRSLLHATVQGESLPEADVARVNAASEKAPRWPVLVHTAETDTGREVATDSGFEPGYDVIEMSTAAPALAAQAEIARDAIALLGGALREDVRACHAPGCVQYFVKDHPRREWCSAACGNRARVARHYTKSKGS